jgi:hypothetical protein
MIVLPASMRGSRQRLSLPRFCWTKYPLRSFLTNGIARAVVVRRKFNLDNLGAHLGHQLRNRRTGDELREIKRLVAVEHMPLPVERHDEPSSLWGRKVSYLILSAPASRENAAERSLPQLQMIAALFRVC